MSAKVAVQAVVIFATLVICVGSWLDARHLKDENDALLRSVQRCKCSADRN